MNKKCLIGYSGFVGSTLLDLVDFQYKFNSKNIQDAKNFEYDIVYCAAPSAVKWKANKYPEEDLQHVYSLINNIKNIKTHNFILFSTVDVYDNTQEVDEDYSIITEKSSTYGKNRKIIEDFVESEFENSMIIRLPALFGKNLKKNYIFDLMNNNNLELVNLNSSFQWYFIQKIQEDVQILMKNNIKKINISPQPIKTEIIVDLFFRDKKHSCVYGDKIGYNVKTKYDYLFEVKGGYSRTEEQVIEDFISFFGDSK